MNKPHQLLSNDQLTKTAKSYGLNSWGELTGFVKNLPYGRNANRVDLQLVFTEGKGSCSSKHALLKQIADLNNIPDVKLMLGIYKMSQANTPNIGDELAKNGIGFIPEAHCYLKIKGERVDFTSRESEFKAIENDLIGEMEIEPGQVADFKPEYHKSYLKKWLAATKPGFDLDELWQIRERCIKNLAGQKAPSRSRATSPVAKPSHPNPKKTSRPPHLQLKK